MPRRAPIDRLRAICLALPEATEKLAWSEPTFRAGASGKMFVMFSNNHHNDGRIAAHCASTYATQDLLVRRDPERFFVPPYDGARGWIGVRLEEGRVDWAETAELVEEAYRLVAPKRLLTLLGSR
jgi:hypothetical protein